MGGQRKAPPPRKGGPMGDQCSSIYLIKITQHYLQFTNTIIKHKLCNNKTIGKPYLKQNKVSKNDITDYIIYTITYIYLQYIYYNNNPNSNSDENRNRGERKRIK